MKIKYLSCVFLLFFIKSTILSQIVEIDINLINIHKVFTDIEIYVNDQINKWQVQDRYENTEEYLKRVNSKSRDKKIDDLTIKKVNEIANEIINLNIQKTEYDPDNEVYKVTFVGLPPVYVQVPIRNKEASSFENNEANLIFKNPRYILTAKGFALLELTIQNFQNGTTYNYNYLYNLTFKRNKVLFPFEPVIIHTGDFKISTNETEGIITIKEEINVDRNLPKTRMSQPNAVAVVIGNKDYQKISSVDYAINDAKSIKNYLVKTLGFKEGNIFYFENISKADFEEIFGNREFHQGKLFNNIKPNISDVFIFYSGHGAPGLTNLKGYFVPVGCDPNYLEFRGYSLETFYSSLSKLTAKSVTIVIDACFSGENVHKNISSIIPKVTDPVFIIPNGVLLTSSRATEPSCWYNDQEHGLFTYFFLKAINDKKNSDTDNDGALSYQEIYDYISPQTEGIPYYARRLHAKEQHPTIQGNGGKILIEY